MDCGLLGGRIRAVDLEVGWLGGRIVDLVRLQVRGHFGGVPSLR